MLEEWVEHSLERAEEHAEGSLMRQAVESGGVPGGFYARVSSVGLAGERVVWLLGADGGGAGEEDFVVGVRAGDLVGGDAIDVLLEVGVDCDGEGGEAW